jgi:hypothetical protein
MRFEVHTVAFIEDSNILGCDTVSFGMFFPNVSKDCGVSIIKGQAA